MITLLGTYKNMLVTRGRGVQDESTGAGLHFDVDLKEVLLATVEQGRAQV